ncbi:1-pyrroline-5-carboxylate dehydrogenase [Burkholderia multivorans]|uniref:1-pyrroline-5-carboxylate dehydrogenase n=1 Tax=Burkholderia multivorans TaxID=87883 RepID=UPI0020169054|nr:1-pyrroline-5-carboxylate dehydrogenase [Burkholderia multivorans]
MATGTGLPQLDVTKELNRMLGDGLVEREKRAGGGNEYVYWLARAARIAPVGNAPVATTEQPVAEADAGHPTTPAGIVDAARELLICSEPSDILRRLMSLRRELSAYESAANPLYVEPDAHAITSLDMTMTLLSEMREARDKLYAENRALMEVNSRLKTNNAELEKRIDTLSGDVRPLGSVFVTIGRAAKPMRHSTIEKAQRRGRALVRSEKEVEVLVLEPVGRIVRGTEWLPR